MYGSTPAVVSMSLGGGASSAEDQAVKNLYNAGFVVSVAAGNDNANACFYSPARAPEVTKETLFSLNVNAGKVEEWKFF